MRTEQTPQAEHSGETIFHPLAAEDAPIVEAQRRALAPHKGEISGPEARAPFDAMLEEVPALPEIRTEPGTVGGVPGWWCRPPGARPGARLLYLHGGGYVLGSARAFRALAGQLAHRTGADTFIPDYRLAPEHPFPAAIDDVLAVYRGLVEQGAERIVLAGDSAGGGLALALLSLVAARADSGWLQPRGAAVLSPWTDLALTGDSLQTHAEADPIFTREAIASLAALYLRGSDAADPRASPLQGSLSGLPPLRIDVGENELLLDDSRRYAERARAAGTPTTLGIWSGMAHVFPSSLTTLRAARRALDDIGRFLVGCLQAPSSR